MKHFILALSLILLAVQGWSSTLFEIKTGYFSFTDHKMRKVYDRGGLDVQLSATYPLCNLTHRWKLNAYGAIEYFQKSGRSLNDHQNTSLWSIPVNIGVKPSYQINDKWHYYFAVGPRYLYIHQHNHSSYFYENRSENGLGFFVNTGLNYSLCDHFVIDIFGEYSYAKVHFHSGRSRVYTKDIQVGGFTLGGGIGYEF
jgi:opacity protein-like surface antigen